MAGRTISDERRRWLDGELKDWQGEGILSAEQVDRILIRYETPVEIGERKRTHATFMLQAVAALLVFLATLLLIGYNWTALPREVKLAIIFLVLACTHGAGFYLRYERNSRQTSEAVFFLGCLLFGAAIWLIAQIYHLDSHYPDAFWWWAVGVLPFALCMDGLLGHVLLVCLLGLWAGLEVIGFSHLSPWFFGQWGWVPNGAYTLPLMALPGLGWAYRKNLPSAVGLYALLLAWWVVLQPIAWQHLENAVWFVGTVGTLFLIIAESHRAGSPFAIQYRVWGVLLTVGVLVPLSYYDFNKELFYQGVEETFGLVGLLVILGLVAGTLAATEHLRARTANGPASEERSLLRRQWLPVTLALLMAFMTLWTWMFAHHRGVSVRGSLHVAALLPTILANIAIVTFALWLVRLGVREGRGQPFSGGVACILLWAVLRYADLFGDMGGMLGAAAVFFFCGATLFGLARYWRGRKEAQNG